MARPRRAVARVRAVLPLMVSLLAAMLPGGAAQNLNADRAALLALRDALDPARRLPWDPTAPTPCNGQWRGVVCDAAGGRVVELRLPGKGLAGPIPVGTVGNLTALRKLSLRFNAISGEILADVRNLAELRGLFLRGNRLTGGFPEGLFRLAQLRKVDLAGNRIAGGVPVEFNKLARLEALFLEGNQLGGTLPAGLNISKLAENGFNVSFNALLTGPVPASLARMPASAFLGTGLCGGPLAACATPPASPPSAPGGESGDGKRGGLSRWAIVGIIVGAVFVILLTMGLVAFLRRRRAPSRGPAPAGAAANVHVATSPVTVTLARTDRDAVSQSYSHSGPPLDPAMIGDRKALVFVGTAPERPYDLDTLLRASAEVLSKGVHGTTYRATLDGAGNPVLAIKRLREVHIPEHEFCDKAAALGALYHGSLPRLRAYFYGKEEKLLVYDFVGAGSLSSLLHDNGAEGRAHLDFTSRARIALAAARGVAFIHRGGARSSHGNIKSSNIVVTATRDSAHVAGYGIPQLVGSASLHQRGSGYRAPEVTDARTVPQGADVYSFGVVLLELLSGRAPAHARPDCANGVDLPRWVRSVVQEEWTSEVFDSVIANETRVEEEMMRLLQLGIECTERQPDRRPAMAEVEARIERIVGDASRKADFSSSDSSRSVST